MNRVRIAVERNERAIGQHIDAVPMRALGSAIQSFPVKYLVHLVGIGSRRKLARNPPRLGKGLRVLAPAFETRPMTGGQRGRLVEKEQFGVIAALNVALPAFEIEHTANPLPRGPATFCQCFSVGMETPPAVAEQQAARRHCDQFAQWVDAVLQWHCRLLPSPVVEPPSYL